MAKKKMSYWMLDVGCWMLDVGCGSGEFCLRICEYVDRVVGVDTSKSMIQLAKEKVMSEQYTNTHFVHSDIFNASFDEMHISKITAFNVLHLVDDLTAFLERVQLLLPQGGHFITQTPCLGERHWLFQTLITIAKKIQLAPPILSLTFTELESLMTEAGFEIVEVEMVDENNAVQKIVAQKS